MPQPTLLLSVLRPIPAGWLLTMWMLGVPDAVNARTLDILPESAAALTRANAARPALDAQEKWSARLR